MKKYIAIALLMVLGTAYPAYARWSVGTAGGGAAAAAQSFSTPVCATGTKSTSPATVQLTDVVAGDLIVVWVGEFATNCTISVSDGTDSLTATTRYGSYAYGEFFYLLSSTATGTVTYTATCTDSVHLLVQACRTTPAQVVELDGTPTGATGTSTTASSGNITVAGTPNIVFGGVIDFNGGVLSSPVINSSAAEVSEKYASNYSYIMATDSAAGFTGAAGCTISASEGWIAAVIGFK
jgi:hypothetical protein